MLLEDIRPNYHSITDFRKKQSSFKTFKLFVSFLKTDLIEIIAIDGKAELTIARKPISIKENRQTLSLY
jgi:hypothetical protein